MERRIRAIEERNRRVELDKGWETSITRRAVITITTYVVVVAFLHSIRAPNPWVNAAVPAMGYALSTLVLPPIRKLWERRAAQI